MRMPVFNSKKQLFRPEARNRTQRHKRVYAFYELWYRIADFMAAFAFLVGSFLFFSEATKVAATWCFVIGSIFFLLKPSLRMMREFRFLSLGDVDTLAKRAGWKEQERVQR